MLNRFSLRKSLQNSISFFTVVPRLKGRCEPTANWFPMKKSLMFGVLALAATATPCFGLGTILLDNYDSVGPLVTYGSAGIPADGISGFSGTVGTGLLQGWTLGLYYALGDVTRSISSDPTQRADPGTLGGGLTLATGSGSTAPFDPLFLNTPGTVVSPTMFGVPGTSSFGGNTITIMLIAYNTSAGSYADASWRGHSTAFTMTTSAMVAPPHEVGNFMSTFAVVPEPSAFALSGLGAVALLFVRRRR
jgi:hypothetical protein